MEIWGDQGLFEGAWAGDFLAPDFHRAGDVFGSGAFADDRRITFVTPSHTCERLQLLRDGGGDTIRISNSLCMLLAESGARLDPTYAGYARDFSEIVYGIGHAVTPIPTADRRRIELVYFRNIEIDSDLNVTWRDKPPGEAFTDFAGYERVLADTVARVASNAADAGRAASRYALLTSISSGYDSPACAALALRAGCRRSVTLTDARASGRGGEESDSGADVARAMGLDVIERSRLDYQSFGDGASPEAEFLATGMSGEDVNLLPFEDQLRRAVFLTGFHGDKVWDKNGPANAVLKRGDLSGASLGEFRLRVNFVHVPVPFIGGLRHEQIRAIANSPEMAAWSVGGGYDRPAPRRLAEQAGAPRNAFGIAKKATTALLHLEGPDAMSPGTRRELSAFLAQANVPAGARLGFRRDAAIERGGYFLYRLLRKAKLLAHVPPLEARTFAVHSHTPLGPLPMIWAVERISRARYARA